MRVTRWHRFCDIAGVVVLGGGGIATAGFILWWIATHVRFVK